MLAATSDMLIKLESSLIRPPDDRECANSWSFDKGLILWAGPVIVFNKC